MGVYFLKGRCFEFGPKEVALFFRCTQRLYKVGERGESGQSDFSPLLKEERSVAVMFVFGPLSMHALI